MPAPLLLERLGKENGSGAGAVRSCRLRGAHGRSCRRLAGSGWGGGRSSSLRAPPPGPARPGATRITWEQQRPPRRFTIWFESADACLPQLLEPRPPPNLVPWRRGARAGPAASGRLGLSTSTWHKQEFRRRGGSGPGQRRGTPSGSRYGESSGHEVVPLPALVQLDGGEWPLYALWNFRRLSRKILTGGRHSGQSAFDGEMYWSLCGATGFVR